MAKLSTVGIETGTSDGDVLSVGVVVGTIPVITGERVGYSVGAKVGTNVGGRVNFCVGLDEIGLEVTGAADVG